MAFDKLSFTRLAKDDLFELPVPLGVTRAKKRSVIPKQNVVPDNHQLIMGIASD